MPDDKVQNRIFNSIMDALEWHKPLELFCCKTTDPKVLCKNCPKCVGVQCLGNRLCAAYEEISANKGGIGVEELSSGLILQRVLNTALDDECSDVHVFTVGDELVIQRRRNGRLTQVMRVPGQGPTVIRRIKALAKMDIAESRIPQDGAFYWVSETHESSVRVACLPTIDGEAMVLRLLPKKRTPMDLRQLGFSAGAAECVSQLLALPAGLLLVAGPTSSGKTTTLYAMMEQLVRLGRRVVSIEDPVEQILPDCHQMQVRERIGITFDVGLRAALRQDPDVIMIGEIRDAPTASTALRAALTGHLVLSTTHARDLVGAVARLCDLGLERSLVSEVLCGVIVQHLDVRQTGSPGSVNGTLTGERSEAKVGVFSIHKVTLELAALLGSGLSWPVVRQKVAKLAQMVQYEVS